MSAAEQLLLALALPPTFNDQDFFVTTTNYDATSWIKQWPHWPGLVMAIYGPAGCGKTHLGTIWAKRSGAMTLSPPEIQSGMALAHILNQTAPAYILEEPFEDVTCSLEAQEQLLHVYNAALENRAHLLLISRLPPSQWSASWPIVLPDLQSRLKAVPAVEISQPDDQLLGAVLAKLFSDRQVRISGELLHQLVQRMDRSFEAAMAIVAQLDQLSLQHKCPINGTLVREVLRTAA